MSTDVMDGVSKMSIDDIDYPRSTKMTCDQGDLLLLACETKNKQTNKTKQKK